MRIILSVLGVILILAAISVPTLGSYLASSGPDWMMDQVVFIDRYGVCHTERVLSVGVVLSLVLASASLVIAGVSCFCIASQD